MPIRHLRGSYVCFKGIALFLFRYKEVRAKARTHIIHAVKEFISVLKLMGIGISYWNWHPWSFQKNEPLAPVFARSINASMENASASSLTDERSQKGLLMHLHSNLSVIRKTPMETCSSVGSTFSENERWEPSVKDERRRAQQYHLNHLI